MSRSRKKTPITGMTGNTSEKQFKRGVNRKLRRTEKQLMKKGEEETLPIRTREVENIWSGPKDGKQYISKKNPAPHAFTEEEWQEIRIRTMRK